MRPASITNAFANPWPLRPRQPPAYQIHPQIPPGHTTPEQATGPSTVTSFPVEIYSRKPLPELFTKPQCVVARPSSNPAAATKRPVQLLATRTSPGVAVLKL